MLYLCSAFEFQVFAVGMPMLYNHSSHPLQAGLVKKIAYMASSCILCSYCCCCCKIVNLCVSTCNFNFIHMLHWVGVLLIFVLNKLIFFDP